MKRKSRTICDLAQEALTEVQTLKDEVEEHMQAIEECLFQLEESADLMEDLAETLQDESFEDEEVFVDCAQPLTREERIAAAMQMMEAVSLAIEDLCATGRVEKVNVTREDLDEANDNWNQASGTLGGVSIPEEW